MKFESYDKTGVKAGFHSTHFTYFFLIGSLFQADKKKPARPLGKCAEWKPAFTDCVKAEKFEIGREKFAWDQNFCSR